MVAAMRKRGRELNAIAKQFNARVRQADTSILIGTFGSLAANKELTDELRSYFEQATEKKAA